MVSNRSEVLWSANDSILPKSFLRLMEIYSDVTATFLEYNALVASSAHVVCLNFTVKRRRYLIDNGCTVLGFIPAGSAEVQTDNIEGGADMDVS